MKTRLFLGLLVLLAIAAPSPAQLNCSGGPCGGGGFSSPTFTGTSTFGGPGRFPDGSAATPSIAFTNYPTTGLYINGADGMTFDTGGINRIHLGVFAAIPHFALQSTLQVGWVSADPTGSAMDTVLSRAAAGVLALGTSSAALTAGTLKAKIIQLTPGAFATLAACAAGTEGQLAAVTDSTTTTYGATVTGGGAGHIPAYCNGTAWTVH